MLAAAAQAQETVGTFNLDKYTKALAHYGYTATGLGQMKEQNTAGIINLATLDPTLAKAPRVRLLTINILQKIAAVAAAEKRSAEEYQALQKKFNNASGSNVSGSSDNYNNRRNPPKPDKSMQLMQDQSKISMELSKLKDATSDNIKSYVAQISELASTPEGQQFAMPEDSALLEVLSPRGMRGGRVDRLAPLPPSNTRFEVASATPEGFYGYLMKIDKNTEQNGDRPPGSDKVDEDGNYIFVADRTKTVFVRGYTKPLSLGDVIRIPVTRGEAKVVNGAQMREYVFVTE